MPNKGFWRMPFYFLYFIFFHPLNNKYIFATLNTNIVVYNTIKNVMFFIFKFKLFNIQELIKAVSLTGKAGAAGAKTSFSGASLVTEALKFSPGIILMTAIP